MCPDYTHYVLACWKPSSAIGSHSGSKPSCDRSRVIKYQMVGSQGGSSADGGISVKKEIERLSEKSLGPELKY